MTSASLGSGYRTTTSAASSRESVHRTSTTSSFSSAPTYETMTRRLQRTSTGSSTSVADTESAAEGSASSQHSVPHPLGDSQLSHTPLSASRSQEALDPLLGDFDHATGSDGESQFVLVNGRLYPKPAAPADAPPPYAPYPAGAARGRSQTFPASGQHAALPPLPQYRQVEGATETTPLLASSGSQPRSTLRYVLRGDGQGYWAALRDRANWRALLHLLLINFPFVSCVDGPGADSRISRCGRSSLRALLLEQRYC